MEHTCTRNGNNIYYSGRIFDAGIMELYSDIQELDPEKKSKLYISSGGGDVYSGLFLHDILAEQNSDLFSVVVCGFVASAATMALFAIPEVHMYANATLLFHNISSTLHNFKHEDMMAYTAHIEDLNKRIKNIENKKLKQSLDWDYKELYLDAQQALALGIVNKII